MFLTKRDEHFTWVIGITATRYAIVVALGWRSLVIPLSRKRANKGLQPTYRQARGVLQGSGIDPVEDIRKLRGG